KLNQEIDDIERMFDVKIEQHDYSFYAEKLRKQKYNLSEAEITPYLEYKNIRNAAFYTAKILFGIDFEKINDVETWHEDIDVFLATKQGANLGLAYMDPFSYKGKVSGAWMNTLRSQYLDEKGRVLPLITCNLNLMNGGKDAPLLMSWDDVMTLFHEFGHSLHGLCSNVRYKSLAGTNVVNDYVEFPSQFLENFFLLDFVIITFARHYQTGEVMPQELFKKIRDALTFNQGYSGVEYMICAIADMEAHLTNDVIDTKTFIKSVFEKYEKPEQVTMRHGFTHFSHLFSNEEYASKYYCYKWSAVLSADAFESFDKLKDDPQEFHVLAKKLYDNVF
ncbi:MAG: M3 family metallopeptidase, partial [bacterium]|nr:M3 family metallopeptidase [bacterium]